MEYREGSSRDGGLAIGFEKDWEHSRFNGNYNAGQDFFAVHWETKDRDPNNIRFHVEAPRHEIDPILNGFKQSLVNSILNSDIEHLVIKKGFSFQPGKKTKDEHIKKFKSTEVFRVMLSPDQTKSTHRANLELVHSALRTSVDSLLNRFRDQLNSQFGQS